MQRRLVLTVIFLVPLKTRKGQRKYSNSPEETDIPEIAACHLLHTQPEAIQKSCNSP